MQSDYPDDDWDEPTSAGSRRDVYGYDRALPHSGPGIASCIVGACAFIFGAILIVLAGVMEASRLGGIDEDSPEAAIMGLLFLLDLAVALVGLVLGIVGAAVGDRNKLFAGLGIGINSLLFVGLIALMIIGILVG